MDVVQLVVGGVIVIAVVAFVAWPMIAGVRRRAAGAGASLDDARVEHRIHEYREALRRRTVCESCLYANVAGARYCAECGARLPAASAAAAGA